MVRSRTLIVVGVLLMLLGALAGLEGAVAVLAGSGMAAVGAHLVRSRRRAVLESGFALLTVGVALLIALSVLGGVGGRFTRSGLWVVLLLPYAAGWLTSLAGATLWLMDYRRWGAGQGKRAPQ